MIEKGYKKTYKLNKEASRKYLEEKGLSINEFCRRNGIIPDSYHHLFYRNKITEASKHFQILKEMGAIEDENKKN